MLLIFKRIKACVSPKNILCVETSSEKPLSFIILALLSFSEKSEISVPRQISSIHCCFFFFFFVNDWAVLACRSGDRKYGTSVDDLCVVAEISCKCGRYRSTYRTRRMGLNQMRDRLSAQLPFPESPTCGSILPVLAWILQVGGGH